MNTKVFDGVRDAPCEGNTAGRVRHLHRRLWGHCRTTKAREEKYMRRRREKPNQRDVVFREAERSESVRSGCVNPRTGGSFTRTTTLDI